MKNNYQEYISNPADPLLSLYKQWKGAIKSVTYKLENH